MEEKLAQEANAASSASNLQRVYKMPKKERQKSTTNENRTQNCERHAVLVSLIAIHRRLPHEKSVKKLELETVTNNSVS